MQQQARFQVARTQLAVVLMLLLLLLLLQVKRTQHTPRGSPAACSASRRVAYFSADGLALHLQWQQQQQQQDQHDSRLGSKREQRTTEGQHTTAF
jgi:hypothetical protein